MNDLNWTEIKLNSMSTILVSICKKVTSLSRLIWQFYVYEVFEGRDPASSKAQYTENQTFQLCSSVSSWMDMTIFFTFRTYYWRAAQIYPEWGKYLCLTSKMKSEWYWQGPKLTAISSVLTKSILWYFYSKCIFVPMTMELFFFSYYVDRKGGSL